MQVYSLRYTDSDATILVAGSNFATFASRLTKAHDNVAHDYIGGTVSNQLMKLQHLIQHFAGLD
jgi:hypothetical protein